MIVLGHVIVERYSNIVKIVYWVFVLYIILKNAVVDALTYFIWSHHTPQFMGVREYDIGYTNIKLY